MKDQGSFDAPFPDLPRAPGSGEAGRQALAALRGPESFEDLIAPIEQTVRAYLQQAGLPTEAERLMAVESRTGHDAAGHPWGAYAAVYTFIERDYGWQSPEFFAAYILLLIHAMRYHSGPQGDPSKAFLLGMAVETMVAKARKTRLFKSRGAPKGPRGFKDLQEYKDTIINLIKLVASQGKQVTKDEIASYLQKERERRRKNRGTSAAQPDSIEGIKRSMTHHLDLRCHWEEFVKKVLNDP